MQIVLSFVAFTSSKKGIEASKLMIPAVVINRS
jgi:hypothetical protein